MRCWKLLLAVFLLFSTYFIRSQSVTAVTTRVATASTKSRIETTMVKNEPKKGGHQGNRNSGNQGGRPPTSELTNVTFDFGTRMKTGDFKRSVSLIARVVAKGYWQYFYYSQHILIKVRVLPLLQQESQQHQRNQESRPRWSRMNQRKVAIKATASVATKDGGHQQVN